MNFKKTIFLVFISVFSTIISFGQVSQTTPLIFNNITIEDGLPHDLVNDVVKDKLGFIWIATNDGLCRYDAYHNIRVFKESDDNTKQGLNSSQIMTLGISHENVLYIGTRHGGLTTYDIENDLWETFLNDPNDSLSISNNDVISILEDSKGRIWIGTENGLNLFDKKNRTFKTYMPQNGIEGKLQAKAKAILSISEDNKGWIWIGTWDGGFYLLDIDEKSNDIYFRNFHAKSGNFTSTSCWKIYNDKNDNYWLGTHQGGLFLMTIPEDATPSNLVWEPKFYQYSTGNQPDGPSYFIRNILQDDDDNLWLATVNGLSIIHRSIIDRHYPYDLTKKPTIDFIKHTYDPSTPTTILDNVVTNLHKDNDGTIWVPCKSGLSRYNSLSNQIEDFQLFESDELIQNSQNHIVSNNGKVWTAVLPSSVIEYDLNSNESKIVFNKPLIGESYLSSIYSKDNEVLYFATDECIIKYNLLNNTHKKFFFENDAPINPQFSPIKFMLLDSSNRLWLCSEDGLMRLNLNNEEFSYYLYDPFDSNSIIDNSVTQIIETDKQELWVSTYNGLSKISEEDGKVKFINYKASTEKDGLKSNRLTSLVCLGSVLYIGSDSGLLGYDMEQDKFLDFRTYDNKLFINILQVDNNNKIWGASTNKLFKFDPETNQIINLDYKDGVSNSSYMNQSGIKGPNGHLYFGHFNGYTKVDPISFKTNNTPPPVSITEAKILSKDKEELINVLQKKYIELDPDHYTVEFNFAALDYTRPDKMKFAYILDGFDQDWKYLDKNGTATYTNLDHGEYTFKVKAENGVGIWNEEGTSLKIIVNPTLIETNWFRALLLLLGVLMLYLIFKVFTKRIKARNKELNDYNESLSREIKERHAVEEVLKSTNEELKRSNSELEQFAYIASHDLQEPLKITGSFIDLLATRYDEVLDEDAHKYIDFAKGGIGRMGLLIKNLLTFSKVGGTVLEFKEVSLKNIVEDKLLDLARLISEKNVTIHLGELPDITCEKNQISMLFYNLINNAIKFNDKENPVVTISALDSNDKGHYLFSVADNGIGIENAHQEKIFEIFKRLHDKDEYEGTGIGLALCKKIVARHAGKIWIESSLGEGTTFYFTISKNLFSDKVPENTEASSTIAR